MSQQNIISSAQGRISVRRMPKSNHDVDRGKFIQGEAYFAGGVNPLTHSVEISHVWYEGCKYKCLVNGTLNPPLWNSPDWEFEEGNPNLFLDWYSKDDMVDPDNPEITLSVFATLYNQDITDQGVIKWDWTRQSFYGGVQDTVSDSLWDAAHENTTNSQDLRLVDMNFRFGKHPEKLYFTVTATLIGNDGTPAKDSNGDPITEDTTIEV